MQQQEGLSQSCIVKADTGTRLRFLCTVPGTVNSWLLFWCIPVYRFHDHFENASSMYSTCTIG